VTAAGSPFREKEEQLSALTRCRSEETTAHTVESALPRADLAARTADLRRLIVVP